MARAFKKLSPISLPNLPAGRYSDGGGLYFIVDPSGARRWLLYLHTGGRRREMGLGGFPAVSLKQARELAAAARTQLAAGVDPIAARTAGQRAERAASVTFGDFADSYCDGHAPGLSNDKHRAQWRMTLGDAYCRPIRAKPIGSITTEDILTVLQSHWRRVPETARRLRMRLERVLDAAKARGLFAGDNPARWRGHLDHLLGKHNKSASGHHAALPFARVPEFMLRLAEQDATAAHALRFTILTAARTAEALGATWAEFDLDARVWTVPAARMKAGRDHRVPLTDAALAVLDRVRGLHPVHVFPGPSLNGPLSNMAMTMLLRRMGVDDATVHGFRSSFRDWAAETTPFPGEVVEMALAHTVGNKTEAAYRRGDLFEKRRNLMDAWTAFATRAPGANIVQLPKRA
ncbi:MAG: integrase arm-type DNA-binding domain-containing protein [Rhizobiales bacterium]|nr:integrase arm-type DNA-binding domain-containing protein [Hyphomicrobiales bacterium]